MSNNINLIVGLPRAGSSLITNILSQNSELSTEINSPLHGLVSLIHHEWRSDNVYSKRRTIKGLIDGYLSSNNGATHFDSNIFWLPMLPQLEAVLEKQVKLLVCVRNPAEIITSFERSRKTNPLMVSDIDYTTKGSTSISARAYSYAGPDGVLGKTYQQIKDSVTSGYLDRMLFVDYGLYCNSPKSQTKRIYEFFELERFDHDFNNIPNTTRKELDKTVVNCVQYIGLDLYEQYNREIFWNAWV
jgi:hypothetical protein